MRLSYANITSTLALALALGGTGAYAAATIGAADIKANAVRSIHIKNGQVKGADLAGGSVNTAKVANGSLLAVDFKAGELNRAQAEQVPLGVTLRGTFGASGDHIVRAFTTVSFDQSFAAAPTAHYIRAGVTPPVQCPGSATSPQAAPGHLCIFESLVVGLTDGGIVFSPETDVDDIASRYGFGVYAVGEPDSGEFYIIGTWAATAP